jgi:predicted TIM-barrel fold metal-dependent hydrolase
MDIVSPLPEAMRFALDFSGPDRLLFSSDHPWVNLKKSLNRFSASVCRPPPRRRSSPAKPAACLDGRQRSRPR